MAHNTLKLNGVIDENPGGTGAVTYIPGEFAGGVPLFDATSVPDGSILVDCLYTIHPAGAYLQEACCVCRFLLTYRKQGGNVIYESRDQLFEYFDVNGVYRENTSASGRYDFDASVWSDGIKLAPDGATGIGRVMYDITIITR